MSTSHHLHRASGVTISVALASTLLGACTRYVPLNLVTANRPLPPLDAEHALKPARAETCTYFVLGLIPTGGDTSLDAAMAALARSSHAQEFIDLRIDQVVTHYLLFARDCTRITAQAIVLRSSAQPGPAVGDAGAAETAEPTEAPKPPLDDLQPCLDEQRQRDPGFTAQLLLSFLVEADGTTSEIAVGPESSRSGRLVTCIFERVREWRFAPREVASRTRVEVPVSVGGPPAPPS